MITIIGDSWGCGEWFPKDGHYGVVHAGLEQYLTDAGYPVTNLSGSNKQNEEAIDFLETYLASNPAPTAVFWFVTCPLRTTMNRIYNDPHEFGITQLTTAFNYVDQLAAKYHTKVYILGGLCDIPSEVARLAFDNIIFVINSISSLVIDNFPQSMFGDVKELHRIKSTEASMAVAQLIEKKLDVFQASDFFPDHGHPGRQVHEMIFQQIVKYLK